MIRRIFDPTHGHPSVHVSRPRQSTRRIVSAIFHDPDAAGRAYDSAVELGYANGEIAASAAEGAPTELRARIGESPRRGVMLALEPRSEEEARWIAERWRACGAPEVVWRY